MSIQMELPVLFKFKEAMAYLRVSRSTLNHLLKQGKIAGSKVGGNWRFTEEELKEAMKPTPVVKTEQGEAHE